jgi:hypothetical protein
VLITSVGGLATGRVIGSKACAARDRGDDLGALHKTGVRLGTVLAGGTAGALVAAVLTEGMGEPGSDESVLRRSLIVGLASGALLQYGLERAMPLSSSVSVGFDGRSGTVGIVHRF